MTFELLDRLDDPEPYVPNPDLARSAVTRGRQLRRRRRGAFAAGAVPVVLVLALVAGAVYVDRRTNDVARVDIAAGLLSTPAAGAPYNILVVGLDDTGPLTGSGATPSPARSDTILVVRVDQAAGRLSVLSLPRDLVPSATSTSADRLNGVLPRLGVDGLISTIRSELGIEISHYVQVDFDGFRSLIDATGGISVKALSPTRDLMTGTELDGTCQHLDGTEVLGLVRSRHLEYEANGTWTPDVTDEFGRMDRQAFVLGAVMRQLVKGPDDPATITRLIDVFADHTTIDTGLSRSTLLDLARWSRGLGQAATDFETLPVQHVVLTDGADAVMPSGATDPGVQSFLENDADPDAVHTTLAPILTSC